MEGNTDSDHSMTWEDFFGSTTDLAPSLICIYDSLLEPSKRPEAQIQTAKDARNDPPVNSKRDKHDPPINTPRVTNDPLGKGTGDKIDPQEKTKGIIDPVKKDKIATLDVKGVEERIEVNNVREVEIVCEVSKTVNQEMGVKDPTMLAGSVKLPITSVNKNSLCNLRTKSDKGYEKSDENDLTCSDSVVINKSRTLRDKSDVTIGTLSPNVKRMISSAGESSTLKIQKKTNNPTRASTRFKSNIPLVGATSKISQSGVEIISSIEIYDQPSASKANDDLKPIAIKPEFKIEAEATYDVPTNNRPAIYDIPTTNKTAFESLSLPYIDQSIEVSITCDREFDTKLPSKETSPQKSPPKVPPRKVEVTKLKGTNSLNRKDFNPKQLGKTGPYPETIGSTGNLKSAIPEKEVVRLNTSSEVTRPLSMSSIASSSSTSSSGVQNKGVNSAYLASIESLDDNSDADLTSANGSNNFVNSTGILNKSVSEERNSEDVGSRHIASEEISGLSQLERVCSEIVQTENVYVDDLRQVVEGYLHVWRRETTFSEEELDELFNNIEDIYAFNSTLCAALNCCQLDATCIARCFVDNTSGFSVYTSYCTGYPRTMQRLAALASNQNSAREFRERQIALGHMLPLASYLLKPVQRILKYHLLLQNVVKQCASRDTEYALLQMTGIAQHIDDMKRRHEHAVRVQEIQSLLYGWNGPDLTTYGELCAEGTFRVFGAKAMRHVFLFDKMLLVTKNREDGILAYKSHIMCNNLMLVESIAGAGLSFHVIPWDAPRAQLTLQARSPRHKREWTLLLKRVILENYNAVIPSHARQLVMELGQNKTDDDMLAEKSHNLITQASMRKQLSAPEYLEKRKLDRERRKSFENGIRGRLKKNRKYTLTNSRPKNCDCLQVSAEKGVDYTCDSCYIDLCSDCENEVKDKGEDKCSCRHDDKETLGDKCPECDKALHYIDSGSAEHLERKNSCKCSDFNSSQESFVKDYGPLNKTRGYHSSDNIIDYAEDKSKIRIPKTCLKCEKIKENIVITDAFSNRPSRCNDLYKHKTESLRSKSKDDPQRSKLSKIGTWRRKSEPGLQQNVAGILAKKQESDGEKDRGSEKIEFECRNCGSNKITRKLRTSDGTIISDPEVETQKRLPKPNLEIRMYNTKNIPKKISKIKKSRAKGLRVGSDTTAKFYADFSTDISTENILHITESNDSLNIDKPKEPDPILPQTISKDEDIDEETYKKLIEKTDSFKKNELEKVKYLNKQKVINEGSEAEDKVDGEDKPVTESCAETEQPLEQIISQLLMQNREFQKLVKKQQLRHSAQRRHQRLLKSHSNPEHVIASKLDKLKPHYARQSSDNVDLIRGITNDIIVDSNQDTVEDINVDDAETASNTEDHIYETLRLDSKVAEEINSRKINEKPQRLSPKLQITNTKEHGPESDYVYLSFDQLNNDEEGIYDVPVKSPQKVEQVPRNEYYVTMESPADRANDNIYDSLVEVCRRRKELSNPTGEYLPMSPDQSPNTPEIWLSRQKEHFNISRDRKSGSLPRSFQVVTSTEDNNMTTFKCKPNSNSKTYLNREGKVKSTDRPFTIASDQSELSFDDVENYMNDGDMLKFNKNKTEAEYGQNISQSTLELEEEIDRCYKNNFEGIDNLDKNKNEAPLNTSQPNLNTSITSSCEILPIDKEEKPENEIIHPEHKIYKPTSNVLSLKNVLSRFKNRTPNKTEDTENANEQSSPESAKTEVKSPNEKRSALNPRSYSKNLLQRFRSIIGDEHGDSTENKSDTSSKTIAAAESKENLAKNEIKVVITSTDNSPTTSSIVYSIHNDILSKSVCETTSTNGSESKNIFEPLSHSCDNITQKTETIRPVFDKCVSMVASTASAGSSPSKSCTSSHQINKMPIYMQGSKHLGARIAQSDYADPSTLKEKSHHKNINVLINKNAIRPDSLFSNSSFVTSSSEGTYLECQKTSTSQVDVKETESTNSDESFYEKSFEKIEQVKDEDVFRDSAVYSDQEDDETKKSTKIKDNSKIEFLRQRSFRSHVTLTSTVTERRVTITNKITNKTVVNTNIDKSNSTSNTTVDKVEGKPKLAPPVPVKPKLSQIPSQRPILAKNLSKNVDERSDTNKRPNKSTFLRSESSSSDKAGEVTTKTESKEEPQTMKYQGIQMKRITFERASLDSATRKIKAQEFKKLTPSNETFKLTGETSKMTTATTKNTGETSRAVSAASKVTSEPSKVTGMTSKMTGETSKITAKSVFERRMELESMNKTKPSQLKKPSLVEKPKSITNKMANFEKGEAKTDNPLTPSSSSERASTPASRNSVVENEDLKNSWVKQVVNKFQ